MKPRKTKNDFVAIGVDEATMAKASTGAPMQIAIDLNDDTYREIVENIDGNLILSCDLPDYFHGVYYWNKGQFPYIIKPELKRVMLVNDGKALPMTIQSIEPSAGLRFRFDHENKRTVEDPDGDSCVWQINFTIRLEH